MGLLALLDGEEGLVDDDEPHEAPALLQASHELGRGALELEDGDAAASERGIGHALVCDGIHDGAQAQRLRGAGSGGGGSLGDDDGGEEGGQEHGGWLYIAPSHPPSPNSG
ncbi:hypothetical protein [Corallococcus sicarius]|uniref:Uncharacterized protein n=1 Tax=Corallococcus sicarius TaxID=2316726 RepID=A0A3A8M759_9BACT|nr:hypothetical protein [Corallococcus sicarius]RKH28178.1 hypothetical protein D7X12_40335 [Corallococcus sicarius]